MTKTDPAKVDYRHGGTIPEDSLLALYRACGFTRAGSTVSMWIYAGHDHD